MRFAFCGADLLVVLAAVTITLIALGAVVQSVTTSGQDARKRRQHGTMDVLRRQLRRACYLLYFFTIFVLVCYLCVYVPVALFCESVITSGRKVFRFSNTVTASKFLNRPHRRQGFN